MSEYSEMKDIEFLNYAIDSSPELASLGGGLMCDYETGYKWQVIDEETALFLASAREIVIELVSRLGEMRGRLQRAEAAIAQFEDES